MPYGYRWPKVIFGDGQKCDLHGPDGFGTRLPWFSKRTTKFILLDNMELDL